MAAPDSLRVSNASACHDYHDACGGCIGFEVRAGVYCQLRACIAETTGGAGRRLDAVSPSARDHWFGDTFGHENTDRCDDSCLFLSNDGECDDGGPGSAFFFCDPGTDCSDCTQPSTTARQISVPVSYKCEDPNVTDSTSQCNVSAGERYDVYDSALSCPPSTPPTTPPPKTPPAPPTTPPTPQSTGSQQWVLYGGIGSIATALVVIAWIGWNLLFRVPHKVSGNVVNRSPSVGRKKGNVYSTVDSKCDGDTTSRVSLSEWSVHF